MEETIVRKSREDHTLWGGITYPHNPVEGKEREKGVQKKKSTKTPLLLLKRSKQRKKIRAKKNKRRKGGNLCLDELQHQEGRWGIAYGGHRLREVNGWGGDKTLGRVHTGKGEKKA